MVPCSVATIRLTILQSVEYPHCDTDESYSISVPSCDQVASCEMRCEIHIVAPTAVGAARAAETLLQLIRRLDPADHEGSDAGQLVIFEAPWLIEDRPRFSHRGLMIDSSRNFLPVPALLQTIDAMAMSKFNVLHWHIVDAPSFPLRLPSAPRLAQLGAYSSAHTYSPEDIRHVISFAAVRGIRVVPEIDMPGHSYSWSHSHPHLVACAAAQPWEEYCAEPPCGQLDPTLNETFELIATVIEDVARLFPDNLIHLGGDEVNFKCWQHSSALRERLARRSAACSHAAPPSLQDSLHDLWQDFENRALQIASRVGKHGILWWVILRLVRSNPTQPLRAYVL